ncbi:MAG: hypothetical protein DWQ37_17225 [Planctomycetota bacterium]|nr:MAG: hypothetical protein DWQ37_17225 [Planctomycetota bacterium]
MFPSTCPCDPAAKAWIERRLHWLADEFDDHAFNGRRLVLPTADFFPDRYDGSPETVASLWERVCGYMDVEPDRVTLELISEAGKLWLVNGAGQYLPSAAGTYEQDDDACTIRLDKGDLDHPMALVATMAHELAHARLLGEYRASQDEYDNELLTDLTVVFFGLGLFLANTPRNWDCDYHKWPGTDWNRPEYMTPPMFGYALAHLAWFRGERHPRWMRHLHSNARPDFKQAVRFLFETGDSTFRPKRTARA